MTSKTLAEVTIPMPVDPAIEARNVLEQARTMVKIVSDEDYKVCYSFLEAVKGRLSSLEKARRSIKEPLDKAVAAVQALFNPAKSALEDAERTLKRALADYDENKRRAQAEAQRRADEAAARERRKFEERAAKAAEAGKVERAQELQERAAQVVAPTVKVEAPKLPGLQMRTVYKYRVKDLSLVPREYLCLDEKAVGAVVRALGPKAQIAGIEVYPDTQVASAGG